MIQTHPIYYPLYEDHEQSIILITGGRASGKSFSASTFIERLTFEIGKDSEAETLDDRVVHNVLYTRYTMASADISVIPEFMEKIEADGTSEFFHSTKQDVVNTMTGSRIMFRGIKTSSGNQTAKLKSIHGITTFVVDEAEEWTSEEEFETIKLSIRQKGLKNRVVIIMNPTDKNHWVYKRYIKDTHKIVYFDGVPVQISTHPDVLHIHTTYLDNVENLSGEFLNDVRMMKEANPSKYAHKVMGRWIDEVEGAVFDNWDVVDEFPEYAKHQARGLDFGYVNDPSACIRCGVVGDELYLDELFYKTGMLSTDLVKELKEKNNELSVIADSADQRLIQEIANGGILIYSVQKGAGSIEAGIDKMKSFRKIHITRRSENLCAEFRNYTWDRDKDGNFVNKPIDAWNHGIDASRYYVLGKLLGRIMQPKKYRGDLAIF